MFQKLKFWLFGLALVILLVLAYVFFSRTVEAPAPAPVQSEEVVEGAQDVVRDTSLVISHTYAKGTHTVTGTVVLPTPCYDLTTAVTVSSSTPEVATIVLATADPGGICIQVTDDRDFSVTFDASADAQIQVQRDGVLLSVSEAE